MKSLTLVDCYSILDLPYGAHPATIADSWKVLSQIHHPDKQPRGSASYLRALEKQKLLNVSRDILLSYWRRYGRPPVSIPAPLSAKRAQTNKRPSAPAPKPMSAATTKVPPDFTPPPPMRTPLLRLVDSIESMPEEFIVPGICFGWIMTYTIAFCFIMDLLPIDKASDFGTGLFLAGFFLTFIFFLLVLLPAASVDETLLFQFNQSVRLSKAEAFERIESVLSKTGFTACDLIRPWETYSNVSSGLTTFTATLFSWISFLPYKIVLRGKFFQPPAGFNKLCFWFELQESSFLASLLISTNLDRLNAALTESFTDA